MNQSHRQHERIASQVAKALEEDGYSVVLSPASHSISFSLEGYEPDLLATKGDEHLIVEIKTQESPEQLQRYRRVIDIVQRHPGWRFVIKTIPSTESDREESAPDPVGLEAIENYLKRAATLMETHSKEFAIPYLWNAIVALLRLRGAKAGEPVSDLTDRSLINRLYTLGEISSDEYEQLKRWLQLRNSAIHEINFNSNPETVSAFNSYAFDMLGMLKTENRTAEQARSS